MLTEPVSHQLVQHQGPGDDTAPHGGILLGQREVVVQPGDELLRFLIPDDAPALGLPGTGVEGLQHGLRHTGEGDLFRHVPFLP